MPSRSKGPHVLQLSCGYVCTVTLVRNSQLCLYSFRKHLLSTSQLQDHAIFWKFNNGKDTVSTF